MAPQGEIREFAGELPLSHNAMVVLKKRYLKKDETGKPTEAAPDMFRRVADTIAAIDRSMTPKRTWPPPPTSSTTSWPP